MSRSGHFPFQREWRLIPVAHLVRLILAKFTFTFTASFSSLSPAKALSLTLAHTERFLSLSLMAGASTARPRTDRMEPRLDMRLQSSHAAMQTPSIC